jgi:hypothetical protein
MVLPVLCGSLHKVSLEFWRQVHKNKYVLSTSSFKFLCRRGTLQIAACLAGGGHAFVRQTHSARGGPIFSLASEIHSPSVRRIRLSWSVLWRHRTTTPISHVQTCPHTISIIVNRHWPRFSRCRRCHQNDDDHGQYYDDSTLPPPPPLSSSSSYLLILILHPHCYLTPSLSLSSSL